METAGASRATGRGVRQGGRCPGHRKRLETAPGTWRGCWYSHVPPVKTDVEAWQGHSRLVRPVTIHKAHVRYAQSGSTTSEYRIVTMHFLDMPPCWAATRQNLW